MKQLLVFVYIIKYGKFWSVSMELFVEQKTWNWEEWSTFLTLFSTTTIIAWENYLVTLVKINSKMCCLMERYLKKNWSNHILANFFELWTLLIGCSAESTNQKSPKFKKSLPKRQKIWFHEGSFLENNSHFGPKLIQCASSNSGPWRPFNNGHAWQFWWNFQQSFWPRHEDLQRVRARSCTSEL